MSSKSAAAILQRQFKDLTDPKKGIPSFHIELDDDNIFLWNIGVMVLNPDSLYHGGYFKGQMRFPRFPLLPTKLPLHPCIIPPQRLPRRQIVHLHIAPGRRPNQRRAGKRDMVPAQTVESVLISIISLLDDPNGNSPANIDARRRHQRVLKQLGSKKEVVEEPVDEDFWYESEEDESFDEESLMDENMDDDQFDEEEEEEEEEEDEDMGGK
ncbi:Ubiquitin-conjugating enzyme E2 [Candida viswanathii]|uniref:Ubiquitin-conjugating enzyme E2 n=1 Tax=Candida viswanathii TaxID=5486 RepID=A0A367YK58_9ASCO|nr:Ubiquitin-conjugating enzyme E2 [Candida viswanathii]